MLRAVNICKQIGNRLLSRLLVKLTTLEELDSNRYDFLQPLPPETIATPEVLHLPFQARFKSLQKKSYLTPPIYTTVLEDILYCPNYHILLTKEHKIFAESILPGVPSDYLHKISWRKLFRAETVTIPGYSSVFRSTYSEPYGCILCTTIPRLFLLDRQEYKSLAQIQLLCPNGATEVERFFMSKLLPSNVKIASIPSNRLYHLEKLIFPSHLNCKGAYYLPKPYLEKLQAEFLPRRSRRKINRIFISRKKLASEKTKRHLLNEDELFEALSRLGFEKYVLEELSIEDKIELFYDAETVVGASGSGLANIIFSERINVLELSPTKVIYPHFYYLSKSLGNHHVFWHNDRNSGTNYQHNFLVNFSVDVPAVLELLNSFWN